MFLSCCQKPEIAGDALDLEARPPPYDEQRTRGINPDSLNNKGNDNANGYQAKDQRSSEGRTGKGKGDSRGADKGRGKGHDSKRKQSLEYVDSLPVLPAQLQQMDGTYQWIRDCNAPQHRDARLEAGKHLQEAFKQGGYAVTSGGQRYKVRFQSMKEMLQKTQSLSVSGGLPSLTGNPNNKTEFMYGGHPIEKAAEMTQQGRRVATVNAASGFHAGGGFTSGGRHALEEAFCSQSTLYPSLDKAVGEANGKTPYIPVDGAILSPSVEVFRRGSDQGYILMTETVPIAGVVSVAMYNKNSQVRDAPVDAPSDNAAYELGVKHKMQAMAHAAAFAGADAIIVPDLGCGVFGNDPLVVGRLCGEAIKPYMGYFKKVLFTGKPEFYDAAARALSFTPLMRGSASKEPLLQPSAGCCVCGQPLGGRSTSSDELALLLSLKTGRREGGLQFLHVSCEADLEKKFPGCQAMTLPQATADATSFLKALDVDGNQMLSKEEVRCAVAALWVGDTRDMDREFEEKWKGWDLNGDGVLKMDEVSQGNMPASFISWVRATAVRRQTWKGPSA